MIFTGQYINEILSHSLNIEKSILRSLTIHKNTSTIPGHRSRIPWLSALIYLRSSELPFNATDNVFANSSAMASSIQAPEQSPGRTLFLVLTAKVRTYF
jgi:hypothetical protein